MKIETIENFVKSFNNDWKRHSSIEEHNVSLLIERLKDVNDELGQKILDSMIKVQRDNEIPISVIDFYSVVFQEKNIKFLQELDDKELRDCIIKEFGDGINARNDYNRSWFDLSLIKDIKDKNVIREIASTLIYCEETKGYDGNCPGFPNSTRQEDLKTLIALNNVDFIYEMGSLMRDEYFNRSPHRKEYIQLLSQVKDYETFHKLVKLMRDSWWVSECNKHAQEDIDSIVSSKNNEITQKSLVKK